MKTFNDSTGRQWNIDLNFSEVRRVQGRTDVNLLELAAGTPPLIVRLSTDLLFACDMIFALVEPQAEAAKISDEDFGRQLGPEGMAAAQDALMEELLDFFRRLQRTDIAEMVKTQQALIRAGIAAAEQKIGTLDVQKAVAEILGEACSNLPGLSESTPAP